MALVSSHNRIMQMLHLISGTGNACAKHNNANAEFAGRTNVLLFESVEKAGALLPTGSINEIQKKGW